MSSPDHTHVGYHLGRGTSRHALTEETQEVQLPKSLRLEMTHHLIMGGNVCEAQAGQFNLRDKISSLFKNVKSSALKLKGELFGPGIVVANTKMEQKPVFLKSDGETKSNRPTYAGSWPRRLVLRCVTAAGADLGKRSPHTAASYDSHAMSELLDGYSSVSLDERFKMQTINLDVSGWSPNFLLKAIVAIYTILLSLFTLPFSNLLYVRFSGFGGSLSGEGVASESCPMGGWQPSLDHLIHAAYLTSALADIWLTPKKKRKRSTKALRCAEVWVNVQIDDAVIQSIYGPRYTDQRNAASDVLSFSPAEWRKNHESYMVQGGFLGLLYDHRFALQGPDIARASKVSWKDSEKANKLLLRQIRSYHAARMATLSSAKTTTRNFLFLNIAITRGVVIRKSLSTLLSVLGTLPRYGETYLDTLARADGGLLSARDLGAYPTTVALASALLHATALPGSRMTMQESTCYILSLAAHQSLGGMSLLPPSVIYYGGYVSPAESLASWVAMGSSSQTAMNYINRRSPFFFRTQDVSTAIETATHVTQLLLAFHLRSMRTFSASMRERIVHALDNESACWSVRDHIEPPIKEITRRKVSEIVHPDLICKSQELRELMKDIICLSEEPVDGRVMSAIYFSITRACSPSAPLVENCPRVLNALMHRREQEAAYALMTKQLERIRKHLFELTGKVMAEEFPFNEPFTQKNVVQAILIQEKEVNLCRLHATPWNLLIRVHGAVDDCSQALGCVRVDSRYFEAGLECGKCLSNLTAKGKRFSIKPKRLEQIEPASLPFADEVQLLLEGLALAHNAEMRSLCLSALKLLRGPAAESIAQESSRILHRSRLLGGASQKGRIYPASFPQLLACARTDFYFAEETADRLPVKGFDPAALKAAMVTRALSFSVASYIKRGPTEVTLWFSYNKPYLEFSETEMSSLTAKKFPFVGEALYSGEIDGVVVRDARSESTSKNQMVKKFDFACLKAYNGTTQTWKDTVLDAAAASVSWFAHRQSESAKALRTIQRLVGTLNVSPLPKSAKSTAKVLMRSMATLADNAQDSAVTDAMIETVANVITSFRGAMGEMMRAVVEGEETSSVDFSDSKSRAFASDPSFDSFCRLLKKRRSNKARLDHVPMEAEDSRILDEDFNLDDVCFGDEDELGVKKTEGVKRKLGPLRYKKKKDRRKAKISSLLRWPNYKGSSVKTRKHLGMLRSKHLRRKLMLANPHKSRY